MENQLKLTKEQLGLALNQHIVSENGINDLFEMMVNGLMLSERQEFLVDPGSTKNKGNGYRDLVKRGLGSKLSLKVPRDRLGLFKPLILGILEGQEEQFKELSFALYGKGLSTRQISEVIEQIYGTNFSKSSVSRISVSFNAQVNEYLQRPLDSFYPVVFVDAIYLKLRRDTVCTEAFYVLLGLKQDLSREVLGIVNIPTESALGWQEVLGELKQRGLEAVGLFVQDDLRGLDDSIGMVFPKSQIQKCILHFQRTLSKHIRVRERKLFCQSLKQVFSPDDKNYTQHQAINNLKEFLIPWQKKYPSLTHTLNRTDLEYLFTYLKFDYRVRRMIYTTNWIERLNKSFRRTIKIRNALPNPQSALTLLGYVAMEMDTKTYKYPIMNFMFDNQFNQWSVQSEQWKTS